MAGFTFLVDCESVSIAIAIPGIAASSPPLRLCLYDHARFAYVKFHGVEPHSLVRIPVREVLPTWNFSIKVQSRQGLGWVDELPLTRLGQVVGDLGTLSVCPGSMGIQVACRIRVTGDGRRLVDCADAQPDDHIQGVVEQADFGGVTADFLDESGNRLIHSIRLAPDGQRGRVPVDVNRSCRHADLEYSVRRDVTLAPLVGTHGGGIIGAWEGDAPIPEAMDFLRGRQMYRFRPFEPVDVKHHYAAAIYLGRPYTTLWGHFLTQGLARVWYALEHPEVPVIWDSYPRRFRLRPRCGETLALLGLRNPQLFVDAPTHIDELVFPFPGMSLKDNCLKGHAAAIGLVQPENVIPGKRLLMSKSAFRRTRLSLPPGVDEAIDELFESYGFQVYHPEQHSVAEQLREISSSETVAGVEGSAFHSVLLLRDPVATKFWALRRTESVFEPYHHIRAAKNLQYETLDFRTADGDMDLRSLAEALDDTDGFRQHTDSLRARIMDPVAAGMTPLQAHFGGLVANCLVTGTPMVTDLVRAQVAIDAGDLASASLMLARYL